MNEDYIADHISRLNQEGGLFIMRRSDINNLAYQNLVDRKFIGLKSEMEAVLQRYRASNGNKQVLIDELDLGENYFNRINDEFYIVEVKTNSHFEFDIPNGNESGAYSDLWVPGGYTKHGTFEVVISNSKNFKHNNDFNTYKSIFGNENVIPLD